MKQYSKNKLRRERDMKKNAITGEMVVKNAYLDTIREVEIMAKLGEGSGSIIQLHEVIDSEKDDKLILILDYAHYGEIMSWDDCDLVFETCLENKKFFNETDI